MSYNFNDKNIKDDISSNRMSEEAAERLLLYTVIHVIQAYTQQLEEQMYAKGHDDNDCISFEMLHKPIEQLSQIWQHAIRYVVVE